MKQSEHILKELRDKLVLFPDGLSHTYRCYHCRLIKRYLNGSVELDEHRLRALEAHLLAQIALREARSPF